VRPRASRRARRRHVARHRIERVGDDLGHVLDLLARDDQRR
jgi:hypothetical protein